MNFLSKILLFLIALFINKIALADNTIRDPFSPTTTFQNVTTQHIHWQLYYAHAEHVAAILSHAKPALISAQGTIVADNDSNSIWIQDDEAHLTLIKEYLRTLDQATPQILIRAWILAVDDMETFSLGLSFKTKDISRYHEKNIEPLPQEDDSISWPILSWKTTTQLLLKINALSEKGNATTLAQPELLTNDRETAEIETGESVPYQEKTGEGNTSVTFKKAVLRLKVTPTVLPNHFLNLNLSINQDKATPMLVNGVPTIRTQHLMTSIKLKSNETVLLGGIYIEDDGKSHARIPILSKIPLIGFLFHQKRTDHYRRKLMILVTPTIVP